MKRCKTGGIILDALYALLCAVCVLVSLCVLLLHIRVLHYNGSPSMPIGFYLNAVGDIREGDAVVLDNPRPDLSPSVHLLKRVRSIEDGRAYLEGRSDDELYELTGIDGIRSFDSRYFGTVEVGRLKRVVPLIIWR